MISLKFLVGTSTFTSLPSRPSHSRPKKTSVRPLRYQFSTENPVKSVDQSTLQNDKLVENEELRSEEKGIGGIHVPRQRYIAVPKAELLEGLLSLFDSEEEMDQFRRLSMCLDSILHVEHKDMLEEMRSYYSLNHLKDQKGINGCPSVPSEDSLSSRHHLTTDGSGTLDVKMNNQRNDENDKTLPLDNILYLKNLLGSFSRLTSTVPILEPRVAVATNFQRSFMQLLRNAEFEELSAQDLLLTDALNSDYLLTLPIYVDWKRESESKAIIFRRGYATERQKGLLLVEKLDYLQSKLLQEIFFSLSRPVKKVGTWLNAALKGSREGQKLEIWVEKVKLWLKEQYSPERPWSEGTYSTEESDQFADSDLPIWLAAQRAIPRYEGLLSSVGPRERLVRKLLTWIGIIPLVPEASVNLENKTKYSESYLRPNFLPRITLSNLWEPAKRELCGGSVWKMFQTAVSILFSQSTLQEPAFQELILLYSTETSQSETRDESKSPPLQFKIYEQIPIPDLAVVFPHKKLSFRILDTVRLDAASIVGLLAYIVNYKFEDIASSPSAVLLDVLAISALIIYVSRVVLGYKQTWDRYQLLVNTTLYEKTLASGFGAVYFLLDASEQQQYKEAVLAYALLVHSTKHQLSTRQSISDSCERFMYDKFNEKIEMPIDKAMNTLSRLGIASEFDLEGSLKIKVLPCSDACDTLRKRWDGLLEQKT